jgi:chromate reductase
MIGGAQKLFDPQGSLTDEPTRAHIRGLLEALHAWTLKQRG